MADMCSSSRSSSRASRSSATHRKQSAGNTRLRNSAVAPAATETVSPTPPQIKPKFKPSLKMAATGVMSMSAKPKSIQKTESSSTASQSWTTALSVRSPNIVTGRYQMPGGRVYDYAQKKPAWKEPEAEEGREDGTNQSQEKSKDEIETKDKKKGTGNDQTPRKTDKYVTMRYYRPDSRSLDASQLTKDLIKCKYLRRREQDKVLDLKEIFRK
nr:uncharacterized protein LOC129270527 [Lytechinus pictus]